MRANAVWKRTLAEYEAPPIDDCKDEELREVDRAEEASFPDLKACHPGVRLGWIARPIMSAVTWNEVAVRLADRRRAPHGECVALHALVAAPKFELIPPEPVICRDGQFSYGIESTLSSPSS